MGVTWLFNGGGGVVAGLFNRGWLCCIMSLTGLFNGGEGSWQGCLIGGGCAV